MAINIGLVDDHKLFLDNLAMFLDNNTNFNVMVKATSGKELQGKLNKNNFKIYIMLVDVNMPDMGGCELVKWIKEHFPKIKLVALSMKNDDFTVIKMMRAGCCAYLLKDSSSDDLKKALIEIHEKGFYDEDVSNLNHRHLRESEEEYDQLNLTEKELIFLKYACSDLTYKQIADKMGITERTVDSYREHLFIKFKVQSRVTLCLEVIKREIVDY